ncbi:MAG: SDR family NAD(P)-dependent oxidoreductase [Gemmatimonadales bacterium]|nr:MAG: SDR family NAD(P)-dependent oxidoreductase [Gemmatimonadales bacterium]
MSERLAVITGANRGIGRATAAGLARAGFETVLWCRTPEQAEAAVVDLEERSRLDRFSPMAGDLADPDAIRDGVGRLRARYQQIHLLVNNAGVVANEYREAPDGHELTLAVNHLAPVRLTLGLLPSLLVSRGARIVTLASAAHDKAFDPSRLKGPAGFRGRKAYTQSKLLNFLFTFDLAERLEGSGVSANVVHPGVVSTGLLQDFVGGGALGAPVRALMGTVGSSPDKGARTTLRVATDPILTGVTGRYFRGRQEATPPDAALDREARDQARRWTAELTGLDWAEVVSRTLDAPR